MLDFVKDVRTITALGFATFPLPLSRNIILQLSSGSDPHPREKPAIILLLPACHYQRYKVKLELPTLANLQKGQVSISPTERNCFET